MNIDMWERFITDAFGFVAISFGVAICIHRDKEKEISFLGKLTKAYKYLWYLGSFVIFLIFVLTIRPVFNGYDVVVILHDPFSYLWGCIYAALCTAGVYSYWIVLQWRYRKWAFEPRKTSHSVVKK